MENALKVFMEKRGISVKDLVDKKILQTNRGNLASIAYLRVLLGNVDSGLSAENCKRLDKAYKFTDEEKTALDFMVRRANNKLSPEEVDFLKKGKQMQKTMFGLEDIIRDCQNCRTLIGDLEKKAEAFKLLICVNWKQHGEINKLSQKESLRNLVESFIENRTEAATIQSKILTYFRRFEERVLKGVEAGISVYGKLPSSFGLLNIDDFLIPSKKVENEGKQLMLNLIGEFAHEAQTHFVNWITAEAEKNNGVVNIESYVPLHIESKIASWFEAIFFPDIAYTQVSLPFMSFGDVPIRLFGMKEVVEAVEKDAHSQLAGLTKKIVVEQE